VAADACRARIYTVFSSTYGIPWNFFLNLVSQVQFLQGVPPLNLGGLKLSKSISSPMLLKFNINYTILFLIDDSKNMITKNIGLQGFLLKLREYFRFTEKQRTGARV